LATIEDTDQTRVSTALRNSNHSKDNLSITGQDGTSFKVNTQHCPMNQQAVEQGGIADGKNKM
jgi:VCBS repeat-containing protein